MNDFQQNYNFEQQQLQQQQQQQYDYYLQMQREEKSVKIIENVWLICVISVFFTWGVISTIASAIEVPDLYVNIIFIIIAVICIAQHVIAIVGKIKYPKNRKMHSVFIGDMILLVVLAAFFFIIEGLSLMCDYMCGDCG